MSLRVLLADESDTIKKVFQLALQDLNAEVKSVHSGLDVMDVARTFKPDIVFADILLQKKNGYEICLQIKQSTDLKNIPVVLMWSSFMELDQAQYKRSLASDQLEKPFDADNLREIVKKHSTTMNDNPMSSFLSFPKIFTVEAAPSATTSPSAGSAVSTPSNLVENEEQENTSEFNLGAILSELNPSDAQSGKPNKKINAGPAKSLFDDLALDAAPSTNQESWKEKDLSQFKISEDKSDDLDKFEALNLSSTESTTNPAIPMPELSFELDKNNESEITPPPLKTSLALDEFSLSKTILPTFNDAISTASESAIKATVKPATPSVSISTPTMIGMNDSGIEAIVRAHTEEVIKNHIKDSLIHVVEKIVREELHRIMEEELRLQQDADIDS